MGAAVSAGGNELSLPEVGAVSEVCNQMSRKRSSESQALSVPTSFLKAVTAGEDF